MSAFKHKGKPHRLRKPYCRKKGGVKFVLGSTAKHGVVGATTSSKDKTMIMASLLSIITSSKNKKGDNRA